MFTDFNQQRLWLPMFWSIPLKSHSSQLCNFQEAMHVSSFCWLNPLFSIFIVRHGSNLWPNVVLQWEQLNSDYLWLPYTLPNANTLLPITTAIAQASARTPFGECVKTFDIQAVTHTHTNIQKTRPAPLQVPEITRNLLTVDIRLLCRKTVS